MDNHLAPILRQLVHLSGKKAHRIAADADLDVAYVRKLMSGEKRNPSISTVAKLACGIVGDSKIIDEHPELAHTYAILFAAWVTQTAVNSHRKDTAAR